MSNRSETFGRLLKGAINSIAAYEGKTAPAVEDELGAQIGVAGSTIQRYKAGYLPTEPRVVQILAEAAVRRGYLSRAWLTRFLQAARYPSSDALLAQLADALGTTGTPRDSSLPSGTLVFLFTDIEGSTTLWEQHAAAMERALARHDQIMRQTIDAYGGHVFNTSGDAFQAVFTTAADALDAMLAAQRTLHAEAWGPVGPIRVRAALHVGAAQQRGGDYFGPPLNRVARLCAAGHGGQILLSNATQELVRDALSKGVELRDLGEQRLKDLARPERVFQVVAPDVPADFPPLRTLDSYTHNLPAQPTPLIGRETEVLAASDLLRRDNVRLLTLTGPGGIGKTRLALQAAAELVDDFYDGVYFVPLAPIRDPSLVLTAIAQALGVTEAAGRTLDEVVKAYLHSRQTLLLLDNFEHLAAAGPLAAALLTAGPKLKLLVTSREVLHLYGEHEYEVPPLSLPDVQRLPPIERLTQYEAVRLFIERAQAVRSDFAVTIDNAPAIAEVCVRLDGLPLAIELAAARSKLFPPKALLARLDKRLALLTGGPRDLPARQQTLRNTIAWSYNLLDAAEQAIFARLGVFVGASTLEAAEAVLADDRADDVADLTAYIPTSAVLPGVMSLVDKSLLKEIGNVEDEPRFIMLETIREYAMEQLDTSGETAILCDRHADYYLALAEVAAPELHGAQHKTWLDRLDQEIDNLRAALAWSLRGQGSVEVGLRLSAALWWFWLLRVHISEGRAWLAEALAPRTEGLPLPAARAKALLVLGDMMMLTDNTKAAALLEQSLALYRQVGDRAGAAQALYLRGTIAGGQGDYARAIMLMEESLVIARSLGDTYLTTWALLSLGNADREQGELERATARLEEALTLCRDAQNQVGSAWALCNLGHIALAEGDYPQAQAKLKQSLALFRELDDRGGSAIVQIYLGRLARTLGNIGPATLLLQECLKECREFGLHYDLTACLTELAGVANTVGEPARAARLFGAAAALRESVGSVLAMVYRAQYERDVAATRTQLDAATWDAAWAAGRAMTLDQAIAEALAISGSSE